MREISRQETLISFTTDDGIRNFLAFNSSRLYERYNLSPNPVDILSIDKKFLETDLLIE